MKLIMSVTVNGLLVLCLLVPDVITYSVIRRNVNQVNQRSYRTPPSIQMQMRILQDFVDGPEAKITLIYQSSRPTQVRWFRKDKTKELLGSEIPGFFPLDGDPRFWTEYLTSDDVTSVTLHIRRYRESSLPDEYETIITTRDGVVQYNLKTEIGERTRRAQHTIRSPVWLKPPLNARFAVGGSLEVSCEAVVPWELQQDGQGPFGWSGSSYVNQFNEDNELSLNRIVGGLQLEAGKELVMAIRVGSEPHIGHNTTEQGENGLIIHGSREPNKLNHVFYDINMTTPSATNHLEGIYQCSMERRNRRHVIHEKSYINSEVILNTSRSAYLDPNQPDTTMNMRVKPCNDEPLLPNHDVININVRKRDYACVRCVVMGYPRPEIRLLRQERGDEESFVSHRDVIGTEYVNVADGGLTESTYVFLDLQCDQAGKYVCRANYKGGAKKAAFYMNISGC